MIFLMFAEVDACVCYIARIFVFKSMGVDPHYFHADPDRIPFHFNADPDPAPHQNDAISFEPRQLLNFLTLLRTWIQRFLV
jgi:hypothetical protein